MRRIGARRTSRKAKGLKESRSSLSIRRWKGARSRASRLLSILSTHQEEEEEEEEEEEAALRLLYDLALCFSLRMYVQTLKAHVRGHPQLFRIFHYTRVSCLDDLVFINCLIVNFKQRPLFFSHGTYINTRCDVKTFRLL